ncbi:MAG: tRNA (pseudouridine(54)-N(1))-methyltransferase TrmY [Haloferacaceae archaeon]
MRQFLVVGHDAPTGPDFPLDDLAGGAGRLDVLCRCVTAALLLSHGVREDARVHLVLGDEFTLRFDGGAVRRLNPDERSTAALIRTALEHRDEAVGRVPAEPSPGLALFRAGLDGTLDALAPDATVVRLHEAGRPAADRDPPADPLFVLSDHRDLTPAERERVDAAAADRLRLGPRPLHADQAVTVAHNYLDTDGFTRY